MLMANTDVVNSRQDVEAFIRGANKTLKSDVLVRASDMLVPDTFTTGSVSADVALGGGWPGNKWVQVIGHWTAGKTAITLKTVAANQKLNPNLNTFWLAAEHYDTTQARALGVDNSRVTVAPVQEMELGLDLLLAATESQVYDILVLDSYPALLPHAEDEKSMAEFGQADGARRFNQFWRKAGKASRRNHNGTDRPFLGIIINQYRDKIGGVPARFGIPQTSPGGHGQDYAYYTRVDVARKEWIKETWPDVHDPVAVGQTLKLKTIKNKASAPQRTAEVDFYFNNAPIHGFKRGDYDTGKECVTMGLLFHVIQHEKGSYLSFQGETFNGKPALQARVLEDLDFRAALTSQVLAVARDPKRVDAIVESNMDALADKAPRTVKRRA
jgi:recombination protein RecA